MEFIFFLLVIYGLYTIFASGGTQSSLPRSATDLLYISVEKDVDFGWDTNKPKKEDFTLYKVKGEGALPNQHAMELSAALYIYDDESNLPLLSNFAQTDESTNSRVFRRDINLGYQTPGLYFPKKVELTNVILEGIHHPHKGEKNLRFCYVIFLIANDRLTLEMEI